MISPLAFDSLLGTVDTNPPQPTSVMAMAVDGHGLHKEKEEEEEEDAFSSSTSQLLAKSSLLRQHQNILTGIGMGDSSNCGGGRKRKLAPINDDDDGAQQKRRRELQSADNAVNQNESNSNESANSTTTMPPVAAKSFSVIEQQLAGSSPNAIFQQTLLDLVQQQQKEKEPPSKEDAAAAVEEIGIGSRQQQKSENTTIAEEHRDPMTNEQQQEQSQRQMIEFFEAQKIFQKLCTQFTGSDQHLAANRMNPFQQLAQFSPFLFALQSQQQQQQQFGSQQFMDSSSLFDNAHTLLHPMNSQTLAASTHSPPFGMPSIGMDLLLHQNNNNNDGNDDEEEGEEENGHREGHQQKGEDHTEPEDLSIRGRKETASAAVIVENFSDGRSSQNGTERGSRSEHPWSYEEQFKQLYDLSDDPLRKEWLDDWLQFMHQVGKPVTRIPIMAKSVLDLYDLYRLVVQHGGLVEVINKKLWREITKGLKLPNSITSAAFTLRTQYAKYLYDYECHRHNFSTMTDLTAAVDGNKREGRRPPAPSSGGSGGPCGTPNGPSHQHHLHHRASSEQQQQRADHQQQQQQINAAAAAQMMAAALSASAMGSPPGVPFTSANFPILPPPSIAAAFFGKQLNFGMPARGEDVQQQLNALKSSTSQAIQQFGLNEINNATNGHSNFSLSAEDNMFPKLELAASIAEHSESNSNKVHPIPNENMDSSQHTTPEPVNRPSNNTTRLISNKRQPPQMDNAKGSKDKNFNENRHDALRHNRLINGSSASNKTDDATASGTTTEDVDADEFIADDRETAFGPFGELLKNASRCSLKLNANARTFLLNGGSSLKGHEIEHTIGMENGTTPSTTMAASGSMVVSMELNGILYQGVLFAVPNNNNNTVDNTTLSITTTIPPTSLKSSHLQQGIDGGNATDGESHSTTSTPTVLQQKQQHSTNKSNKKL